jgi:ABC-type glycerol-3-phosphate transport system permease component
MNAAKPNFIGSHRQKDWPKHAVILLFVLVELFPLYMMLQVSFKDNAAFIQNPWVPQPPYSVTEVYRLPPPSTAAPFADTVTKTRGATWSEVWGKSTPLSLDPNVVSSELHFDLSVYKWSNWSYGLRIILPAIANSIFVAVTATSVSIVLAIFGAYFFARQRMPFSGVLWGAFMVLMLMPGVANIVPLFSLLKDLDLINTLWAIIVVGVAGGQVFNIFVLRNFIEDLPRDLFEAAEMDGASHLQQIRTVVIPLSMPIIGTLSILAFLGAWNEFLLPLIVLRDGDLFPIGVRLIYLDGEYVKQWGPLMAAYFIASIPLIVIFLFCMRLFVRGLSAGAIKG